MSDELHTCSYYCERAACVLRQRNSLRDRADALAAENARLREALRMIEDCVTDDPGSAYVVAKTALAAPKEGT